MVQSLVDIYIHAVFHTKGNRPIPLNLHEGLYLTMRRTLRKYSCVPLAINGTENHVHLLFGLSATKTLAQVIRMVKVVGHNHLKEHLPPDQPFAWQRGYYAQSVSKRYLQNVKAYIANQKEHHRKVSQQEELRPFNPNNP